MTRAADAHSPFEAAFFDRVREQEDVDRDALAREIGLDVQEAKYEAAVDANTEVIHRVAATPARTWEGYVAGAVFDRLEGTPSFRGSQMTFCEETEVNAVPQSSRPSTRRLAQAATNLLGYVVDGGLDAMSKAAEAFWHVSVIVTEPFAAPLDTILADPEARTNLAEAAEFGFEIGHEAKQENTWLLCQCYGTIALICRHADRPMKGQDREVFEIAKQLYATVKQARA